MGTRVSVVIPVFEEQDNVAPLYKELCEVLPAVGQSEIVFVDDGSRDSTFDCLRAVAAEDPSTRVVRLRRNFGQTAALAAGVSAAQGEVIVFMDGDRQNDPADIPRLLERIEAGFDVVSGWRRRRKDNLLSRRLPSLIANWVISTVTGVKLRDYGCTLKAYRREVINEIQLYGEMHRFIPVFAHRVGAALCEIEVNHRPRVAGRSKYGIGRTLKVLFDLITVKFLSAYSTKPIYVFGAASVLSGVAAAVAAGVALYQRVVHDAFVHRNPLFTIAVFLGVLATQFLLMGLIAELAIRTYHESQGKPIYVVRETLNPVPNTTHSES